MAATKTHSGQVNAVTQDRIRSKIKVFEIVKALQDHILNGLKMTNTQVRAAEILMRKVSPDLLATAISDDRGSALPVLQIVRRPADISSDASSGPPSSKVVDLPEPAPAAAADRQTSA